VGLDGAAVGERRTFELSGGEQQRLVLAAALSMDPQVLILDNVTDLLDPAGKAAVEDLIGGLIGEKTLVVVSRDADFLLQYADRLLVLAGGRVAAFGEPRDVLRDRGVFTQADLTPPVPVRVAHRLGVRRPVLSVEELAQALGPSPTRGGAPARERRDPQGRPSLGHGKGGDRAAPGYSEGGDPAPATPPIKLEGVTFRYASGPLALRHVDLTVRRGEVHAVVGAGGAGKTTLVHHVAGLLRPGEGRLLVGGQDTRERTAADLAFTVGTVLQNPDEQLSERSVEDEIACPLRRRRYEGGGPFSRRERYSDSAIRGRVAWAAERAGLGPELLERDPVLLSRGERKLVTMAAALALDPPVLALDEPTVGFGATALRRFAETIRRLRESGKAVVLAENDIDLVCEVADTVTVLQLGEEALQGTVREVFTPANAPRLEVAGVGLPRAAEVARRFGVEAITPDELAARLRPPGLRSPSAPVLPTQQEEVA